MIQTKLETLHVISLPYSPLTLTLVVSKLQTIILIHLWHTATWRTLFLPHNGFLIREPRWYFICGGEWHRPHGTHQYLAKGVAILATTIEYPEMYPLWTFLNMGSDLKRKSCDNHDFFIKMQLWHLPESPQQLGRFKGSCKALFPLLSSN